MEDVSSPLPRTTIINPEGVPPNTHILPPLTPQPNCGLGSWRMKVIEEDRMGRGRGQSCSFWGQHEPQPLLPPQYETGPPMEGQLWE